ncbi:hypothetical protein OCU72_25220, partial [Escherichia coli]|nr:hypothetical protein [Escherichia coli]
MATYGGQFTLTKEAFHAGIIVAATFCAHTSTQIMRKRAARTVLTGMCYSVGSATRQGEQFADPVYRPVGYD